jgi:hypothetical protein
MTYELQENDKAILKELENGTPEGIRDAAQQMSTMQNNDEWKAIQSQFQQDRQANGSLPDIQFGPDGSMVVNGAKGLPQGERFDGPMTKAQNNGNPVAGIEHEPAAPAAKPPAEGPAIAPDVIQKPAAAAAPHR